MQGSHQASLPVGSGPDWGSGCAECRGCRASPGSALFILQLTEKLLDLENENMMRVAELEKQLLQRDKELESIKVPSGQGRRALTPGCCWRQSLGTIVFLS